LSFKKERRDYFRSCLSLSTDQRSEKKSLTELSFLEIETVVGRNMECVFLLRTLCSRLPKAVTKRSIRLSSTGNRRCTYRQLSTGGHYSSARKFICCNRVVVNHGHMSVMLYTVAVTFIDSNSNETILELHWGFFPGHQTVPCALGSTQPLKMSTRIFLGVKTAGA
jgi:hypothetical protein